jgi:F-type H+-transporting ATPase subunit gamma
MPSLKSIRKRITSVKATQKITRAMKMVAGARLARAQARITALRPYAVKTQAVLAEFAATAPVGAENGENGEDAVAELASHPFLVVRPEKTVLLLLMTSDRGLCGAFNSNLNKAVERAWRERSAAGQDVRIFTIGRKGRDYLKRRGAPVAHEFAGVWEKLDVEKARLVAKTVTAPLLSGEVDAIYVVYNEFKSAMTQKVTFERLLPLVADPAPDGEGAAAASHEFIFEPNKVALLERLVPMYVEISILRALLESMASELGARMTAMDAATKNAKEMIASLTLQYNRARQASITKELMEIIGGAEALKE